MANWGYAIRLTGAAAALMTVTACSTLGPNDNPAVPGNYKQLIAASLAEKMDWSTFIKAEVSQPGIWDAPLAPSASRPIACARMTVEGTFGPHTYEIGYKFVNGRIDETFNPFPNNPAAGGYIAGAITHSATCGKLAYGPLQGLAKPKQAAAKNR